MRRIPFALALLALLGGRALVASPARAQPAPGKGALAQEPAPPPPSSVAPTEHEKSASASHDERSADPRRVQGIEREAVESGDNGKTVGAVVLFPLRELFAGLFFAADSLGELARKGKFVSRMDQLLFPQPGEVAFVPIFFIQSRHPASFGGRIVAAGTRGDTSLSVASAGPHDVYVASVVNWRLPKIRSELSVDALYDERNTLEFRGIGQDPDSDPRDKFRPTAPTHDAYYLEKRSRLVASLDYSAIGPLHIIPSSSLLLSRVEDAIGSGDQTLGKVFEPTTPIASAAIANEIYSEVAVRAGTRKRWQGSEPGAQAELYGGYGAGVDGTDARYVGAGGRAVGFIPIFKKTNTLSPRIVIDTVAPVSASLPFNMLAGQPDFRGFDLRRDKNSMVVSLDYRWIVMRYVGTSIFVDSATLAPQFGKLFTTVPRFAGGFGFDVFNAKTDLAHFAVAGSGDGVRILASFGYTTASGDRQHRK